MRVYKTPPFIKVTRDLFLSGETPEPYSHELPYVPTALPTVGALIQYSRIRFVVREFAF